MLCSSAPVEQARALIPSIRVCSFDIFDTFLVRRCAAPDGVFELAWTLLNIRDHSPISKETFVQHRIQAEARARHEALQTRDSGEVRIDEIYARFPVRLFGIGEDDVGQLIEAEFEAELSLCRVNPDIAALLDAMQAAGRSTGFISDTYWPSDRIARLLTACRPGLSWDFLLASCEHRAAKAEGLFLRFLERQGVEPRSALHIGDNEASDIKGAGRAGIHAIHYPQASASLRAVFEREEFMFKSLFAQSRQSVRLDGGLRTVRRVAARITAPEDAGNALGHDVLGPVFAAFDRFLSLRIEHLKRDSGKRVAVAFLGRDGMLPFKLWQRLHDDSAHYLEINRRVSIVASANTAGPLCQLFKHIPAVNAAAAKDILKARPYRIDELFKAYAMTTMSGAQFAKALMEFFEPDEFAAASARMREQLVAYLRTAIPDFDSCTDLVLVDLGYSATVQKALRRIFDLAGIGTRLHGLYLLTREDAMREIAGTDTVEGFISDLVVTPHAKNAILRNIAPIEQICCSSHGSVRYYKDGMAVRERDARPQQQIALSEQIQAGALDFAGLQYTLAEQYQFDPYEDETSAASWSAAILGRLLLMPTAEEIALLSSARHDVNLGTQTTVPLVDSESIRDFEAVSGLGMAFVANEQPMWLAASLAQQSPLTGILYSLFGAGLLPNMLVADRRTGAIDIALIAGGRSSSTVIPCHQSLSGLIRIRIPIVKTMAISAVAVPIGRIASHGRLVRAITQSGPTVTAAMGSGNAKEVPPGALGWIEVKAEGGRFRDADAASSYLSIALPGMPDAAATVVALEFEIIEAARETSSQDAAGRLAVA